MRARRAWLAGALWMAGAAWAQEEGRRRELERRLETQRLPMLAFEGATLGEVADYLSDATGINFLIHPEVELGDPITLRIEGISVRSFLNFILKPRGLMYFVRDDYVEIAPKTHEPTYLVIYDVRDLMHGLVRFVPDVELGELTGGGVGPVVPGSQEEPEEGALDLEQIIDLIQAHTGGDSWETHPGVSISSFEAGGIVVRQTQENHRQIRRLLDLLR